jgi:hypothetical protein
MIVMSRYRSWALKSYSRISQHFMEPESSLPSTGSYPESDQSSPNHPILSKIHFNIIYLPTSRFSWCSLSFCLSHRNPICIALIPHLCHMFCSFHPPWLDYSIYTWRRAQVMKESIFLTIGRFQNSIFPGLYECSSSCIFLSAHFSWWFV